MTGARMTSRATGDDETHVLRTLVAESLEIYASVFVMLNRDDPDAAAAATEVQQAYARTTKTLEAMG